MADEIARALLAAELASLPIPGTFTPQQPSISFDERMRGFSHAISGDVHDAASSVAAALMAPGNALRGEYNDVEIMPDGSVNPVNSALIEQALNMAGAVSGGGSIVPRPTGALSMGLGANFDNWFTGSKVVNKTGQPLRLYKGSPTRADGPLRNYKGDIIKDRPWRDIESFDSPGNPYAGFFTDDPAVASRFADVYSRSLSPENPAAVFPVYANMKNPYVIDMGGRKAATAQFDDPAKGWSSAEYKAALNDERYDGVILVNTADEGTVYIPKKPTQVKSAIANSGAYDPADPNILRISGIPVLDDEERQTQSSP